MQYLMVMVYRCVKFREHAELLRTMLWEGACSTLHMLSYVQSFGDDTLSLKGTLSSKLWFGMVQE